MKKFILAAIIAVIPFTVYAPEKETEIAASAMVVPPTDSQAFYSTEASPFLVVKDSGRYKVINVNNVLFIPQFYRRKAEAEFEADKLNVTHAKEYMVLVAQ